MVKAYVLVILGLLCAAVDVFAQSPRDVPDVAQHEIARRGNMAEFTGTIRSGLMAAALAPPADDSAKWFVTLVVKRGDVNSDVMRSIVENDKDVRHWVDANDPAKSTTHYQLRSIDDPTQADWLAGLQEGIRRNGLPVFVLQPPRSGQFGSSATIVKMIHGRCTGKELSEKLRDSVVTYVKAIEQPRGVASPDSPIGIAPPFNVQPVAPLPPPNNPQLPIDWPPSAPAALTAEQIRSVIPDADADFILKTIESKETSLEIVKLRWQARQKPTVVVNDEPESEPVKSDFFQISHPYLWMAILAAFMAGFGVPWATKLVQYKIAAGIASATQNAQASSPQTIETPPPPIAPTTATKGSRSVAKS